MHGADESNPTERRLVRRVGLWVVVLVLLTFFPSLACAFINYDDNVNFVSNEALDYPWSQKLAWIWTTQWLGVYQPLAWMLIIAEHATWSLEPMGYHAMSLVLHGAVAWALLAVTIALLRWAIPETMKRAGAFGVIAAGMATLLFCVHPLRTEVVAWPSAQPYLPSILCMIVGVWAYLKAHEADRTPGSRRGWLVGSFLVGAAAMLFKAVAVTYPLILLDIDWYPLGRLRGQPNRPQHWPWREALRALVEKVPLLILGVVLMKAACQAKGRSHFETGEPATAPLSARLADAALSVWFYPYKTLVPTKLTIVYPRADASVVHLAEPRYAICAVAVLVICALAWVLRRRWPGFLAAWVAYLIILAPNSGLVRFSRQFAADRYSYAASLPWVVLLAAGLVQAARRGRWSRMTLGVVGGALTLGLSVLSWNQADTWRHSAALWSHALESGLNRSLDVHLNLAMALSDVGRKAEAFEHALAAVQLAPGSNQAHRCLATAWAHQSNPRAAVKEMREAVRVRPDHALTHYELGRLFLVTENDEEAEVSLREAIKLDPGLVEAHRDLGVLLARGGKPKEALAHLQIALRIPPDDPKNQAFLARFLADQGTERQKSAPSRAPCSTRHPTRDSSRRPSPKTPSIPLPNPWVATASLSPSQAPAVRP